MDLKGIDEKVVEKVGEEGYFTREKKNDKVGEEAFFKQGEKPEVSFLILLSSMGAIGWTEVVVNIWVGAIRVLSLTMVFLQKKQVASARASDQKAVDKSLLTNIKKEPMLLEYLRSSFSLRKGDRPHEMKW